MLDAIANMMLLRGAGDENKQLQKKALSLAMQWKQFPHVHRLLMHVTRYDPNFASTAMRHCMQIAFEGQHTAFILEVLESAGTGASQVVQGIDMCRCVEWPRASLSPPSGSLRTLRL